MSTRPPSRRRRCRGRSSRGPSTYRSAGPRCWPTRRVSHSRSLRSTEHAEISMTTDLLPAAQDRPLSARFDARRDECGAAWCRRADLRETISDYLIRELERYGVAIRDRSEIAELHGGDGQLACRSRSCSSSWAHGPAPTGWATSSRATRTASSSQGPPRAASTSSRPASRASSQPVTSALAQPSAVPAPSAKAAARTTPRSGSV